MSSHPHNHTANRTGPNAAGAIEDAFVREVQRRFRNLRGLLRTTVGYENDALQLTEETDDRLLVANDTRHERVLGSVFNDGRLYTYVQSVNNGEELIRTPIPTKAYESFHAKFGGGLTANAEPRERFDFTTQPELVNKFIRWVRDAIREEILEPPGDGETLEQHWISQFIRNAYLKGYNQGTGLLFQQGASVDNPPNSEILGDHVSARALQTLYTRTYENLRDITRDMADVMRDELTEGFARGENPRKMADRLTSELRNLQRTRAETLARTETINAATTAQLDRYERAGVQVVSHEWKSANDTRTCPFCERLDGVQLTIDEVRDGAISWAIEPDWKPQTWRLKPPAHPRCRCSLLPVVGATNPPAPISERVHEEFEDRADVLL